MRICHISDTHIRNYKYHKEYENIFEQIYSCLREQKVDLIVHCGDIAHTKTQLSPEYFDLASSFLKNLADIAPTYIILGNHDGNLKNEHRQDAVTPIVRALQHKNLHLLKESGEVLVGDITFNVLSVFDEDNWVKPSDPSRINIALYHGSVSGARTDTGWVMDHGDHPISIFEGHDFAFLGDIHKTNQILDDEGRVRWPGSTIQQNFAETDDKGILIWDIKSKEEFTCEHIPFDNPKPFITINLTKTGKIPRGLEIKNGARLRLVSNNNLSLEVMRKALDVAKQKYKPDTITFLNRAVGQNGKFEELTEKSIIQDDMRNPAIQENLIREYLKDYEVSEELMKRVLDLNSLYTKKAEESEEISRNIKWNIEELQWSNLFNYGEDNKIDFNKLNGVVGIFGKNYTGKSSIIDAILYTIFNTTTKNERKTTNIINQNKEYGSGELVISINDEQYYISRNSKKYIKRLKGEETTEAKTELNFYKIDSNGEKVSLNGLTRNDTDKNIRKVFGTIDDFLLTSMSSQLDSLSFIREGSTKRKEIVAKFLDLEIFENKFRLAKEDASDMKGALRRIENIEFDSDIQESEGQLQITEKELVSMETKCSIQQEEIDNLKNDKMVIEQMISSIPAEIIDIVKIKQDIRNKTIELVTLQKSLSESKEIIKNKKELMIKMEKFLSTFDIDDLNIKKQKIVNLQSNLSHLLSEIKQIEKKQSLLDNIPCGDTYPTCKFIKDAIVARANLPEYKKDNEKINNEISKLEPDNVDDLILKYNSVKNKKETNENEITRMELQIVKTNVSIQRIGNELQQLKDKENSYEENKEAIENLESLNKQKNTIMRLIDAKNSELQYCKSKILSYHRLVGSLEQKVEDIKKQKQDYIDLREQFAAYDLYMRCMHPAGIAYEVIRKKLPVINEEIAKILSNLTNFEIFFEEEGKNLEISIKHPTHEPRPLSMASGAEKTMAAMAIRLAFLSISNLPTSNIMILDEPGTALDEEHLQAFTQLLDMIKGYFKTILLISHLDSLKDVADLNIDIIKKNNYAFINQ